MKGRTASTTNERPAASSPAARKRMQGTAQRGNRSERRLRSALHIKGIRFRNHYRIAVLPRRSIDIALVGVKIAIFIDGCFWHGCPRHGTMPKSNRAWWKTKINTNQLRDRDTNIELRKAGWKVMRIWEHQPVEVVVLRIIRMRSAVLRLPSH